MTPEQQAILTAIEPVTSKFDVPTRLISAIIEVESNWNTHALGDNGTSWGIFQLHFGGQANAALRALTGHGEPWDATEEALLYEPLTNALYAMPSIAVAWDALKATFDENSPNWWRTFAAESGHPGGSAADPDTQDEATKLRIAYEALAPAPPVKNVHTLANFPIKNQRT